MRLVMARIFSLLCLSMALCNGAFAQDGGAEAGLEYARTVCSECHAVRADDFLSPNPKAPPFAKIAATPGITGTALFVILQTPHRDMPDLIIPAKEKADIVAYILSLQK
jgi:mono/diheme cytochrome c family protein